MKINGEKASALMHLLAASAGEEPQATIAPEMAATRLLDHYADLAKTHEFKPGMLVQRKAGLNANTRYPMEDQPGIVTVVLETPIVVTAGNAGSIEYGKSNDIRIMTLHEDGYPIEFAFDSRFFEPYTGKVA